MAKPKPSPANYVRKETMLIVAFAALVAGFAGGVLISAFKSPDGPSSNAGRLSSAPVAAGNLSTDTTARIVELEQETARDPANGAAWIQLGNLYFDSNQYQKAIDAYLRALEIDPANADVWTDMGVMYRRNGQPQEAIKAFDQAMAVDPRHEVCRFNKGIVLLHDLNDLEGALQAWQELLEINPVAMAPNGQSVDQLIEQFKKMGTTK